MNVSSYDSKYMYGTRILSTDVLTPYDHKTSGDKAMPAKLDVFPTSVYLSVIP